MRTTLSILWRRLDQPGHDAARLVETHSGAVIEGTAVFSDSDRPCRLDYHVQCDSQWRTRSARVIGWVGATPVNLAITVDRTRGWTMNGTPYLEVHGAEDVDLSFTPATNLLPIRRLRLGVGASAEVRAAWLLVPELSLEPLDQSYTRASETCYAYESSGGRFKANLETNAAGVVTHYQGLWQIESEIWNASRNGK
jgi:uncharacterized protein